VLHKDQVNYQEAGDLFLDAIDCRHLKLGDTHPHMLESWKNLIELYEAWDRPEKVNEWRAKLPETEAEDK
jgi:hypothetical protein